jgi:hypothetical protein
LRNEAVERESTRSQRLYFSFRDQRGADGK